MKWIIPLLLILTFSGCSEETTITPADKQIIGVWFTEDILHEENRISKLQYTFKQNNTFELLRIELDINSKIVLGYRSKTTGSYRANGNQLTLLNLLKYSNDDTRGAYSPIKDLILVKDPNTTYTINYQLEEDDKKLTLIYPPCIDANCIDSVTFNKE